MIELFIETQDALFFEGYTEQTAQDNPEKFDFEYKEFLDQYSK